MKRTKYIVVLVVLIMTGIVFVQGFQLLSMGSAYKSKMLCSEIFVAGRDVGTVEKELSIDDLTDLRHIGSTVDREAYTVRSSLLGLTMAEAQYSEMGGCAISAGNSLLLSGKDVDLPNDSIGEHASLVFSPRENLTELINDAFAESNPERPKRTRAVIVIHKGKIVAEKYASNIGQETPLIGWSMSKSVVNALVGVLIKDDIISLDSSINHDKWSVNGDLRSHITVRHLLNMTSGLEFNESMSDPLADVSQMILKEEDMAAYAADKMLEEKPGSRWQYSSGNTNLLSEYIRRTLGEEAYVKFPKNALFGPLGLKSAVMEMDASGTYVGSSFMYATAREWARIGLLYLQNGKWEGQQILPSDWVQFTATPSPSNTDKNYGAHFWLKLPESYKRDEQERLPQDTFHAVGHEGQFITIVPSHEVVIVRLGKTRYAKAWEHDVFVSSILSELNGI